MGCIVKTDRERHEFLITEMHPLDEKVNDRSKAVNLHSDISSILEYIVQYFVNMKSA